MAPHQAQRTLVKSRPELWAEVSDVTSLCKHLGEFGDITITRLEPETTVAWEGTAARGTVELETSGWGTKVTLTAELLDVEVDVEVPQPEAVPEPEPVAVVTPRPAREPDAEVAPVLDQEPAPAPAKVGFLARLLRRKPAAPVSVSGLVPSPAERAAARAAARGTVAAPVPSSLVVEPLAGRPPTPEPAEPAPVHLVPEPEPDVPPVFEPAPSPDGDDVPPLVARTVVDGDRAVEVLTGALDDLGAAHRRPFSH